MLRVLGDHTTEKYAWETTMISYGQVQAYASLAFIFMAPERRQTEQMQDHGFGPGRC